MNTSQRLRRQLVRALEKDIQIRAAPVLEAFGVVPRETFIPEFASKNPLRAVYAVGDAIPTRLDDFGYSISSSSAPSIMAVMLEQLSLERGLNVLEIGTGTGYNAALIKHIVGSRGRLTSIDIDERNTHEAAAHLKQAGHRVRVVCGDGRRGVPEHAPYDRIIATVSCETVPKSWVRQVRSGGRIVLPLQVCATVDHPQIAVAFERHRNALRSVDVDAAGFMGMRDTAASPATFQRFVDIRLRGGGASDRMIAMLTGAVLETLDDQRIRRLLGLALDPQREKKFAMTGAEAFGFQTFFALSAPQDRLIVSGLGLVDRNARSFAYLLPGKDGATLRASGRPWAEQRIERALEAWTRRGRPTIDRLRLMLSPRNAPKTRAWRTFDRDGWSWRFNWAKTSK